MGRDSNEAYRNYQDSIMIKYRQLDCVKPSSECELFSKKMETPIVSAAMCVLNMVRENGNKEYASGIKDAGSMMFCGHMEKDELQEILSYCDNTVRIIKPFINQYKVLKEIREAEELGCLAVGMDIDHGFNRFGENDMNGECEALSFERLKKYVAATKLPFIVKGILNSEDAIKAKQAGAKALVVSSHHGIMDYAIPPLKVLPEIRKAVGEDMIIFIDGIYCGADVFKSLALGADFVMAGRVLLDDDFKKDGCKAVANRIDIMTKELKGIMAHTGFSKLEEIDDSVLFGV